MRNGTIIAHWVLCVHPCCEGCVYGCFWIIRNNKLGSFAQNLWTLRKVSFLVYDLHLMELRDRCMDG
ncbi:hypothetical protein M758_1G310700 [Ceratodon purpureus]|nr:hypothetical protein M758_1G310700 [Ceratodon purpureus]